MTAGFHSPLPPARSGVADYAAALLPALARHMDIRVNAPQADVFLYHLGNNGLHRDIYRRALAQPGAVVLHDVVLHHLLLGALDQREYTDEFVYNYGEWSRDLAGELWRGRARSGSDPRYFQYALVRRIAETSKVVIVHNPAAAAAVRAHHPPARVIEIPHLFAAPDPPAGWAAARLRQAMGLAAHTFVFGVFGYLRESKRLAVILRVFRRLRESGLDMALLVAGDFVSEDLERAVGPLFREPGVVRESYVPEADFWRLASMVDACIALRYPAAGETSGIAIRLMGIGKPVLVTASEENSRFPETACLRVAPGVSEAASLEAHMIWLVQSREAAREIGRRAEAYIRENHSLDRVATLYRDALRPCLE